MLPYNHVQERLTILILVVYAVRESDIEDDIGLHV